MDTLIELKGEAAADAQTLVVYLQDEGIPLLPVDRPDRHREIPQVAVEFGVAFLAHASAGIVHDLVRRWLDDRDHEKSEADVRGVDSAPKDESGE